MCGIFGFVAKANSSLHTENVQDLLNELFKLSEKRGSEASGLVIVDQQQLQIYKRPEAASQMLQSQPFQQYYQRLVTQSSLKAGLSFIGHSRLVTNGIQGIRENNQPVTSQQMVGVHNGIIVNEEQLWRSYPDLEHQTQVDSEVIYRLIDKFSQEGLSIKDALKRTYRELVGEANIIFAHSQMPVVGLATNVGSLYVLTAADQSFLICASEKYFLSVLIEKFGFLGPLKVSDIQPLKAGEAMMVNTQTLDKELFELNDKADPFQLRLESTAQRIIADVSPVRSSLRRCTRCILPHTFPFIHFNDQGVCNFCTESISVKSDNKATLEKRIAPYRRKDGQADCIVALSGGRDSCYGLHVIKRELGMNPIAYTYDWAMVTDEARRNCSRICAELGVEHIIRSADILSKRRNIRANIDAWLHRPELGMVPLFMAGDKQFFHYASQVSRQNNVPLVFFCGGNNLEVTRFKTGFCGIQDRSQNTMVGLNLMGKVQLLAYYAKNYLLNPRYFNRSMFDTFFAYYSTYMNRQDFIYLYRYIDWNEEVIHQTLKDSYGWESSNDSASTWRIGDGTAAFYNYIYFTVAGFSEHDTFRSNQIRAGLLTREKALALVEEENKPRYAAMREYAHLVGFSLDEALVIIDRIPKLR